MVAVEAEARIMVRARFILRIRSLLSSQVIHVPVGIQSWDATRMESNVGENTGFMMPYTLAA